MKRLLVILLLCLPIMVGAQNAKIKHLTAEDSLKAKQDYESYVQAKQKWEKTSENIGKKYILKTESGWGIFEFTDDFKAIVPVSSKVITNPCGIQYTTGSYTLTTSN